jgi:hypothetical protein
MANDPTRPVPAGSELARIVAPHLLAFCFPLYTLADRFRPKLRGQPVPETNSAMRSPKVHLEDRALKAELSTGFRKLGVLSSAE